MVLADQTDSVFCRAVHYTSFRNPKFRTRFYDLLSFARRELDAEFVPVKSLFD